MDDRRFDALVKSVAAGGSRRAVLKGLLGLGGVALAGGAIVYGALKATVGLRLSQEEEFNGADLSIHKIGAVSQD